ncbi:MAG TPA: flagellar assembly protein FliH [Rhodocyclaceae bacterium]|nr:flagellar assembly protein FliH [Rhodocyclaceae bacterium]
MSGYIPKEHLDAYRRWQVESFDPQPPEPEVPPPSEVEPEPVQDDTSELVAAMGLPTAEDVERIHNEAHESGYRAGFDEGREEGYRQGLEAAQAEARRIAALAENAEASLAGLDQSVADEVLALALEVAHQVLRGAIPARPQALLPVIREALAALPLHHGHVALHVHPSEAEAVREHLGDQFLHSGWRIVEDREIQAGGCFIRAGTSEVDATLQTRWKRVLESIGADPGTWLEHP